MNTGAQKKSAYYFLPFIILILASGFLLALLLTIKEGVFFSGDGGLKYLMVKQLARGGSYYTLDMQTPAWVNKLWTEGFYPFKEPFVYDAYQGKIVAFPPAFQWLNSYPYRWFGFRGIFIISCASIILLWTWFIVLMQKLNVKPLLIAGGLLLLAFCSPLTFYGAVYWEHSLAILLIFSAVVYLVTGASSITVAMVLGFMSGLSVWFRPEMLLLNLLFLVTSLFNDNGKNKRVGIAFLSSSLLSIAAFFIFNNNVYGTLFGAHGYQLANSSGYRYLTEKFIILSHLNIKLVIYFPVIGLLFFLAVYNTLKESLFNNSASQLSVIIIFFLLIVPFVLPNAGGKQWGPRYLLPVIPLAIVSLLLAAMKFDVAFVKKWMAGILLLLVIYSFYINGYLAVKTLKSDYAYRVKPGMDFLLYDTCTIIIVQNQFIAQEFAALFEKKKIFLAENQQAFSMLCSLLKSQDISRVIYLSHDINFDMMPTNQITNDQRLKRIGDYYFAEYNLK
jgi:hypothetical protein